MPGTPAVRTVPVPLRNVTGGRGRRALGRGRTRGGADLQLHAPGGVLTVRGTYADRMAAGFVRIGRGGAA
ncbi:putative protein OS=Streptomyces griseomycini OX=66895 GN=FHS37_000524 PE=4 SV=1 [Streptomyces griseomycini]|uniref:Uncharacterized protein n=1 Tax=Streptomyces griseomycini TaxID=66895 RepID=A0A7W7PPH4_9ACTN|nr:hypothetical protein [Streptomyces griseomycini]GGR01893.1 hypothetical protein GCM10015536_03310 [Streptomyces griseomycini]